MRVDTKEDAFGSCNAFESYGSRTRVAAEVLVQQDGFDAYGYAIEKNQPAAGARSIQLPVMLVRSSSNVA